MPVNFRDLTAGEAETSVAFNGHTVNVTYNPSAITEQALRDVAQMTRETRALTAATPDSLETVLTALDSLETVSGVVNLLLVRFIVRWDLADDDGATMFPLTAERLPDLPLAFRQLALNALLRAMRLGESNGTPPKAP